MKFGSWTYGGLEVDLVHKDVDKQVVKYETKPGSENVTERIWVVDEGTKIQGGPKKIFIIKILTEANR